MVNSFKGFFETYNLSENLQMAKDYVLKKYAEKKGKRIPEITPEEKKNVLEDPEFKEIIDLFRIKDFVKKEGGPSEPPLDTKLLGYSPIFVKFYYEQGANIEILEEILRKLIDYKTNLEGDLPLKIDEYTKIYKNKTLKEREKDILEREKKENPKGYFKLESDPEKIEELAKKEIEKEKRDNIKYDSLKPGYELLLDDLNKIPQKTALRRFKKGLLSKMKAQFEEATPEQLEILTSVANEVANKKPITSESVDPDTGKTKIETVTIWDDLGKKVGSYENKPLVIPELGLNYPNGYYCGQPVEGAPGLYMPDYRDPKKAFAHMVEDLPDFVENWGSKKGGERTQKLLKELGPRAAALYVDSNYEIISCRNYEAVYAFIPGSRFCVTGPAFYWTYNSKKLQLLIWDFKKGAANNMYQIGMSVDEKQIITAAFDKDNEPIPGAVGTTVEKYLYSHGFPIAAVIQTCKNFNREIRIKMSLEWIFKYMESVGANTSKDPVTKAKEVIYALITALRNIQAEKEESMSTESYESLISVVTSIVRSDNDLTDKLFINYFCEKGLNSLASLEILESLVQGGIQKEQWESMREKTIKNFKGYRVIVEPQKFKFMQNIKIDPLEIETINKSLEAEEEIFSVLDQKINKN